MLAGPIFYPIEDAPEVLRFYREFIAAAPDELTTIFDLSVAAPLPFLPEDVHGKPIVMVGACYAGSPDEGAEIVRPLKQFGRPIADLLEPKPYTALQSMFDPLVPHGWHRYWKSVELPPLTDDAIDTLVEHSAAPTSPKSYTHRLPARRGAVLAWVRTRRHSVSAMLRTTSTSTRSGPRRIRTQNATSPGRATSSTRCNRTPGGAYT